MAKNVPLDLDTYRNFRAWLRTTEVVWRDVSDSSIIPSWGEAVCREDCLIDGRTPGERAYLSIKHYYPKLELSWRKEELALLDTRPPKLFQGEYHGELYTLDIKAAFCQIYRKLFLHSDFPNKRLKYPLAEIANQLQDDKQGRNAVVGIARSTRNKWCKADKVWFVQKRNKYLSPTLWAQIMGVLNQCASIAISQGAIFVNTDGYAFTSQHDLDMAVNYLGENGIFSRQTCGTGSILGISALTIPGIKEPAELNPSQPTYHLEKSDFDFLGWWNKLS